MEFRMSPNIAVRTGQFSEAVDFYTEVIGFEKERLAVSHLAANMERELGRVLTGFADTVVALGPSRLKSGN